MCLLTYWKEKAPEECRFLRIDAVILASVELACIAQVKLPLTFDISTD